VCKGVALVHDTIERVEVGLDDTTSIDGLHDDGAHLGVARVIDGGEDVPTEQRGNVGGESSAALHEGGVVEHLAKRL
jgi:hypothetical protein